MLTIQKAEELLASTTTQAHLFLHAKNVKYALGGLAAHFGENVEHWQAIRPQILPLCLLIVSTTVLVFGISGCLVQRIRKGGKAHE